METAPTRLCGIRRFRYFSNLFGSVLLAASLLFAIMDHTVSRYRKEIPPHGFKVAESRHFVKKKILEEKNFWPLGQ